MPDTEIDVEAFKALLLARRQDLIDTAAASRDERRPVDLDQTKVGRLSRMDAMQAQAMSIETDRRRGREIGRIDAALKRIESGDYGYCLTCGDEIALKRLQTDPATPTCVDCAGR